MSRSASCQEDQLSKRPSVLRLPLHDTDESIVAAICAGQPSGGTALYDHYHRHVRRVLVRILGPDAELHDLVQDVFVAALDSIHRLETPGALPGWLTSICVHHAYREINRRSRRRWFTLSLGESRDDVHADTRAPVATPEVDEALRSTYRVLSRLPAEERVAFALRYISGMELVEVAKACEVSLATAKRRLAKAKKRFETMSLACPELAEWVGGGAL